MQKMLIVLSNSLKLHVPFSFLSLFLQLHLLMNSLKLLSSLLEQFLLSEIFLALVLNNCLVLRFRHLDLFMMILLNFSRNSLSLFILLGELFKSLCFLHIHLLLSFLHLTLLVLKQFLSLPLIFFLLFLFLFFLKEYLSSVFPFSNHLFLYSFLFPLKHFIYNLFVLSFILQLLSMLILVLFSALLFSLFATSLDFFFKFFLFLNLFSFLFQFSLTHFLHLNFIFHHFLDFFLLAVLNLFEDLLFVLNHANWLVFHQFASVC
mmetsp:Transcript_68792/g.80201  ORF Transcript_68792/g.80201 Transcript_68792/m.80201 type:complete len:262 (-) Transcript_68792:196-981(-)